jgi:aryl-alcohol dehydrogenase-like predicted oxidoreductase
MSLEVLAAVLIRGLDAGLNVVDTAPGYEDGFSEQVVGRALRGRRDGIFLIDKVDEPDQRVAPQVAASLGRLGLPSADLLVFHGVSSMALWERLTRRGGGMEQLEDCLARGQARFRGISSHNPRVVTAAIESGRCDVVMLPIGPHCDPGYLAALARARELGVGTVGFKAFGAGKLLTDTEGYGWPIEGRDPHHPKLPCLGVEECVRYALTCDPDVELLGMSDAREQDLALAAAARFEPLAPEQMQSVRERAEVAIRGKGAVWWNP